MSIPSNVTNAPLVITNMPELACFENFTELLKALPDFLAAAIPSSISNVIVSNIQPTDSQTTYLWVRLNNSGSFVGLYVFSQGLWRAIYPINTDDGYQLQYFYRPDGTDPAGWTQITAAGPASIDVAVRTAKAADAVSNGTYNISFWAAFTGF